MLPGIGPKTLAKLHHLDIYSPRDLLYHFPHRYIDFSRSLPISQTVPDQTATVTGTLLDFQNIYTRSRKNIQKARVTDSTGTIDLIWFNQPYLSKNFIIGQTYSFAGTVTLYQNRKTIIAPMFGQFSTGKIISVYPQTKNLTSAWFRKTIQTHLAKLTGLVADPLPSFILDRFNLLPLHLALRQIHDPRDPEILSQARLRLSLDETLSLLSQSRILKQTRSLQSVKTPFRQSPALTRKINSFITHLPFSLTSSQKKAWQEISTDLYSSRPCNRLLVGDVGSGKTMLAILASLIASHHHSLTLILAPTEILARQHFNTFNKFLPRHSIHLLTSGSKISAPPSGSIIIATHAAIYQKHKIIDNIGLIVIDEQHRFGVAQRSFLSDLPHPPHTLTMTATPIPRSVSLTLLGHLDLSLIEHPPSDRLPVKTFLVPLAKIPDCYRWLSDHIIRTKQQAFVVCPFIESSDTLDQVKSAIDEFARLQTVFPGHSLGLIHGRLKSSDRDRVLTRFASGQIDILVTTPIIEIGIDYPNATVIIIQSADRFGLSQLHQLRGRVGRGADQSYCYLFSESTSQSSRDRLHFLTSHSDGQSIAEYDFRHRGPGEVFSTIQHGFPSLKLADISDLKLLKLGDDILDSILHSHPDFDLSLLVSSLPALTHPTN